MFDSLLSVSLHMSAFRS